MADELINSAVKIGDFRLVKACIKNVSANELRPLAAQINKDVLHQLFFLQAKMKASAE